jgi:hypothetical protein
VCHNRQSGCPGDSRRSRWPRPSSSEAENSSEGPTHHQARRRNHPRARLGVGRGGEVARWPDFVSGEVEICARGPVCFACCIRCPIEGCQAMCTLCSGDVIMLLRPDVIVVLSAIVRLLLRRGVSMRIKCGCSLLVFGRFCLIFLGLARARRIEWWQPRARWSSA